MYAQRLEEGSYSQKVFGGADWIPDPKHSRDQENIETLFAKITIRVENRETLLKPTSGTQKE